ncbi:MAG: PP0621 family protein [Thiomicrospira sp.]|jgi:uncharacterized protein|nr:PP0621 family protein [Thiomicrospira sp.]
MQVILFLSLIVLAYFLLRLILNAIIRARKNEDNQSQPATTSHTMVRCAQCGVHLPQSEAYYDGRHTYCSEGHLRLGPNLGGDGEGALHDTNDGD